MTLPEVHPARPEVNGFCFSEEYGMTLGQATEMAKTGHVFATEFRGVCEGRESNFSGSLIAKDWSDATKEADRRGLGEKVVGIMRCYEGLE